MTAPEVCVNAVCHMCARQGWRCGVTRASALKRDASECAEVVTRARALRRYASQCAEARAGRRSELRERRYGRGSLETAVRDARALSDKPISASSAAAWTVVATIGTSALRRRHGGRGLSAALASGAVGGADAGAAVASGGAMAGAAAASGGAMAGAAAASAGDGSVATGAGAGALGGAPGAVGVVVGAVAAGLAARLSLRRCGRDRGSEPRRSVGVSSLIYHQSSHPRQSTDLRLGHAFAR